MKILNYIWKWVNATRLRKILSSVLAVLILLTSIRFIFLKPKVVYADSTLGFDEGYGTTVSDQNGKISGTITGAAWKNEEYCKVGKCLYFDGSGDYINFGNDSDVDFTTGSFTIEGWFRVPDISAAKSIIEKYNPTTGTDGGYKVLLNSSGYVVFEIYNNNSGTPTDSVSSSTTAFDDSKWHHFAAVKNGTTSISLYVDGKLYQTDSAITSSSLTNTDSMYMGVTGFGSGNDFSGFLDEIKIYSTAARSASEINADFLRETSSRGTSASFGPDNSYLSNGLVGYWKMDESSWTTDCATGSVLDSSGNNYNGVSCPTGSGPSTDVGKFGNAGSFDGSNDYAEMQVQASTILGNGSSSFTISSWVYSGSQPSPYWRYPTFVGAQAVEGGCSYMGGLTAEFTDATTGAFRFELPLDSSQNCAGTTTIQDSETITLNEWYFITGTYDANTKKMTLYKNGKLVGSTTWAGNGTIGWNSGNPGKITFSADQGGYYFAGKVDEVRIYKRSLSPMEVDKLYTWAPGPVGYWKFDENTGTGSGAAKDISGNGNNGTLNGTTDWRQGKYGSGLNLDGSTAYVSVTDPGTNSVLDVGSRNMTISAWVKMTSLPTSGGCYTIMTKGSSDGTDDANYQFFICENTGTYILYFRAYSGGYQTRQSSNLSLQANTWYHVAMTHELGGTFFYLNGVFVGYDGSVVTNPNNKPLWIGASNYPGGGSVESALNGMIDDVKLYNYPRSASQIIEDMNGGHPAPGSPVGSALGHWEFDEGVDNTCSGGTNDTCNSGSGGSALDGAQTNMAVPASASSGWTNSGKIGKALHFDGADDYVSMGSDSSIDDIFNGGGTFAAWINLDGYGEGTGGYGRIFDKNSSGTAIYVCGPASSNCNLNSFQVYMDGTTPGRWSTPTNSISTATWYFVTVTYDSSSLTNDPKMYINGNPVTVTKNTTPVGLFGDAAGNFLIGNNSATDRAFDGYIDDVYVYKAILTDDQIKQLYNQGSSAVMGSSSTDSSGNPASSAQREYCPPGNTEGNCGSGDPSPVGEWKLDEKSGTVAHDTGTGGNNGTISTTSNPGVWGKGVHGQALHFPGTTGANAVSMGDPANLDFDATSSFTVQGWVNVQGDIGGSDMFFYKGASSSGNAGYDMELGTGAWKFHYGDGGGVNYLSEDIITTPTPYYNKWTFLTAVVDRTNNLAITYVNGIKTNSASIAGYGSAVNATNFQLANYSSGTQPLWGSIDDVKVYNYARTPAQVAWDFNHGGPVAWYQMDESSWNGTAGEVKDASGNELNGVRAGSATTTTSGKIKSSGIFSGASSDYVTVTDPGTGSALDITGQLTISAWIYKTGDTATNGWSDIVTKGDTDANPTNYWLQIIDVSGQEYPDFFFDNPGFNEIRSNTPISLNTWYFLTVTYDDSNNSIKFYIDGKLQSGTTIVQGDPLNNSIIANDNPLRIGWSGYTGQQFTGKIDDVRIYNYVLSPDQIQTVMNDNAAVRFGPNTGQP